MGSIGGMLGLNGGQGGTGFSTQAGTNAAQLGTAYTGTQNSMGNQNALLSALQGQNGLGNQSQVYNQLQNVASGNGPNPAQAMLNQATGQNVQNQAALMAGQRGAAGNVGLMARQNAQQGANIQQQAAGQGATMQANQALGALGQAGGMANAMASQQIGQTNQNAATQQGEQNILQGANSAQNVNQTSMANTSMQQQPNQIGGVMNGIGTIGSLLAYGGQVPNYADGGGVGPQSMFGQALSGPSSYSSFQGGGASAGTNQPQSIGQSFASSLQKLLPSQATANNQATDSGDQSMAAIVNPQTSTPAQSDPALANAQAKMTAMGNSFDSSQPFSPGNSPNAGWGNMLTSNSAVTPGSVGDQTYSSGGQVPAKVSPGEKVLAPQEAKAVAKGKASPLAVGKEVPGQAKVKGDNYKNDTVSAKLPVGGIVLPRSVMQSKNPEKSAAEFVRAHLNKRKA